MSRRREDWSEAALCGPDTKDSGGELAASGGARPVRSVALDRFGLLCAVLAAVGFSGKAILVKLAYRYGVDAETLLALRMAFSLPFFALLGWIGARRASTRLTRRDGVWLFGLGLLGYYLASYLDFLGLRYISAGLERLILFVYPTLVVLLAALWLGQPLTRRALAALALCYAGIALAVTHDLRLTGAARDLALGGGLVFGSALSYALYLLGNGRIVGRLGALRVTALASLSACGLGIGQFLLLRPLAALVQPGPVYALALAMALFSTVLPVWGVAEAIRRLGPGPVALTGSLGPVVTLLLAWLLLDEPLGLAQLMGATLVVAGVTVMAWRSAIPLPVNLPVRTGRERVHERPWEGVPAMTSPLFETPPPVEPWSERLGPGTVLLHGFALTDAPALAVEVARIIEQAPWRQMVTPSGHRMSVAMTNCGARGWVSDRTGYRYEPLDPLTGQPWPPMPDGFLRLARAAAAQAGFADFRPDACLINRYLPAARMSLHQDRDEQDLTAPLVSVSLGLPAVFRWGGLKRKDPTCRIPLAHGDVLVWGGPDRLRYHGVLPLQAGQHPLLGEQRINLTFRKAG